MIKAKTKILPREYIQLINGETLLFNDIQILSNKRDEIDLIPGGPRLLTATKIAFNLIALASKIFSALSK